MRIDRWGNSLRLAKGLLAAAIVVGPHLLAGVYAWSTVTMAAGAGLSWWLISFGYREARTSSFDIVEKTLLVALTIAILHACPLPLALAQFLAPAAVDNAFATAKGLGELSPAWIPFTMDLGGTYERIVFGVVVLATYAASRRIASLCGARWVLMCVAVSVCLVACSTLVHRGLNLDAIYGLYTPTATRPIGPLLNPNVLAGFMAFGLPIVLSHAMVGEHAWIRGLWAGAAVGVSVTLLLAGSRGGLVAACIAIVSFPLSVWLSLYHGSKGRDRTSGGRTQALAQRKTVLAGGLVLIVCLAGITVERIAPEAIDADFEDLSKFVLFQQEVEFLLGDFRRALWGVGRGAFSASFASALRWPKRATHAECFPLQFAIEFGVPLTVVFIGVLGAKSIVAFRHRLDPMRMGALIGCLVIAAHNLVDYGLELSGVAVVVAAAAGTAFSKRRSRGGRAEAEPMRGSSVRGANLPRAPAALCLLMVAWAGPKAVVSDLYPSERTLEAMLEQRDHTSFAKYLRKILPQHTGEPSLAVLAGAHAVIIDDKRMAAFWLNRAMLLAHGWAAPHLWAARWLATLGRWEQAGLELQTAAELDVINTRKMLCSWLEWMPSANLLLNGLPSDGEQRVILLDAAARCLRHAPVEAARLDAVLLAEQPTHWNGRLRQVSRQIGDGLYEEALPLLRALTSERSEDAESYDLQALVLTRLGRYDEATQVLETGLRVVPKRHDLYRRLARVLASKGDSAGMRQAIERVKESGAFSSPDLARTYRLLATLELELGNDYRAFAALQDAHGFEPNLRSLATAAGLAVKVGQPGFAVRAWQELCEANSGEGEYCQLREELLRKHGYAP